jgi:hypothetical protein
MARRSLRPQLNQIRTWVRQGRTDAWIAHQLEVTGQQIAQFKRENDLAPAEPETGADFDDEIDLRAEDDALIAAELDAAEAEAEEAPDADDVDDSDDSDDSGEGDDAGRGPSCSRAASTTARRATVCGWTPPSRSTRSTPSIGPGTGPSRSRSRRTRS